MFVQICYMLVQLMGFNTIAIGRGKDKEELARKLGARQYIDSRSQNAAEELTKLGGLSKHDN